MKFKKLVKAEELTEEKRLHLLRMDAAHDFFEDMEKAYDFYIDQGLSVEDIESAVEEALIRLSETYGLVK